MLGCQRWSSEPEAERDSRCRKSKVRTFWPFCVYTLPIVDLAVFCRLTYLLKIMLTYTDEYEWIFDVIVTLVNALSLLAVVQTLLGDVDEVLDLSKCAFQTALGLGQCLDLRRHLVHLILCCKRRQRVKSHDSRKRYIFFSRFFVSRIFSVLQKFCDRRSAENERSAVVLHCSAENVQIVNTAILYIGMLWCDPATRYWCRTKSHAVLSPLIIAIFSPIYIFVTTTFRTSGLTVRLEQRCVHTLILPEVDVTNALRQFLRHVSLKNTQQRHINFANNRIVSCHRSRCHKSTTVIVNLAIVGWIAKKRCV